MHEWRDIQFKADTETRFLFDTFKDELKDFQLNFRKKGNRCKFIIISE